MTRAARGNNIMEIVDIMNCWCKVHKRSLDGRFVMESAQLNVYAAMELSVQFAFC